MLPLLTEEEARIIGCLMEKSVVTPDQYPLTVNALTNACNQKSSREPVMALEPREVQRTARELKEKSLVQLEENFKNGTEKYKQRLCNTAFNDFQFSPGQFAIVCLLLLRGPQTPGELRARSGRLHEFADNEEVVTALNSLLEWESGEVVIKLPRTPGRKDAEYMHLFSGPVDVEALAEQAKNSESGSTSSRVSTAELAQRVSDLEAEVRELREKLESVL